MMPEFKVVHIIVALARSCLVAVVLGVGLRMIPEYSGEVLGDNNFGLKTS